MPKGNVIIAAGPVPRDNGTISGAGAPALSAAKGTIYVRTDGSSSATRAYINSDGATTWTNFTTAG